MLGSQVFDSFSRPETRTSEQQPKERGGCPLLRLGGGRESTFPCTNTDFDPQGSGLRTAPARANGRQGVGEGRTRDQYGSSTLERGTLGLHLSSTSPRVLRHLGSAPGPKAGVLL